MRLLQRRLITAAIALGMLATGVLPAAAATIPLPPDNQASVTIGGTGATFPAPLYTEWFAQFKGDYNGSSDGGSSIVANVNFDYAATGSGSGVTAIINGTRDYGASDRIMTTAEIASASGVNGGVLHIPATLGSVVLAYNLPGLHTTAGKKTTLKLTSALIGKIYAGKIKKWNDPAIKAVNHGVVLPNLRITPVHRSDGSGTTFIFQSYLWTTNSLWRSILPTGPQQTFPTGPQTALGGASLPGVGVPRSAGVAARVGSTKGAIGYVEYSYSTTGGLKTAKIRNKSGVYIAASASTTSAAAAAAISAVPSDLRILPPVNAKGKNSYPIVGYSFLLVYKDATFMGQTKAQMLVSYLYWALTTGQGFSKLLGYAPLPTAVRNLSLNQIHKILYSGSAIWP